MRTRLPLLVLSAVLTCSPVQAAAADAPAPLSVGEIQTLVNQADVLMQSNQYEAALELLQRAYAQASAPEAAAVSRNVLNSLANLHYSTGDLAAAARYYQDLVEFDAAAGDRQGLSVSLFNLAHTLAAQGDHAAADQHFRDSLQLSDALGDTNGAAFTLKAMGVNAQALGQLDFARELLTEASQQFTALGDADQGAAVQRHLGDVMLASGDAAAAAEQYLQAVPVLARSAFNSALLHTYRGLSQAYEQQGEFDNALVIQRAYSDLMQLDLEQQNVESMQRLKAELETQRYADDNTRLQLIRTQQARLIEDSRERLRLQGLALGLGGGVVVLVLFMLKRSRQHTRRMQHLATTDELTQLLNRRAIMGKGQEEWLRATRFHQPLSCLMFDADHFKSINDTFGHGVGDEVLKAIAGELRLLLRKTDAVGRIGGEEFLLLAPQTDRLQAMALAERIRAGIEACQVPGLNGRKLSMSIGVAGLQGESSIEELIQHADQALYIAKSSGRNRCILYHEKRPLPQLHAAGSQEQPQLQG
jgi:diguanylate cyclase (GGDEF)-like protein